MVSGNREKPESSVVESRTGESRLVSAGDEFLPFFVGEAEFVRERRPRRCKRVFVPVSGGGRCLRRKAVLTCPL